MQTRKRIQFGPRRRMRLPATSRERGIALAIALILLGLLLVFTAIAATLITSEARLTSAQYRNTQAFNAALAGLEVMTERFTALYATNQNPSTADILTVQNNIPQILNTDGSSIYTYSQKVEERGRPELITTQDPPFENLSAQRRIFRLSTSVKDNRFGAEVKLIRDVANYQIPIFQFAAFGFDSLDISPGPPFFLGGRAHCNRHIFMYRTAPPRFFGRITAVGHISTGVLPNNDKADNDAYVSISGADVRISGSVDHRTGPDNPSTLETTDWSPGADDPTVPNGGIDTPGTLNASGAGAVATGTNPPNFVTPRAPRLTLPSEQQGFQAVEILRRATPVDATNPVLANSRYFNGKFVTCSTVRILLDEDLEDFPQPVGAEPRAYDLNALADPNNPQFNNFWAALNNNVYQFNSMNGTDSPSRPINANNELGVGAAIAGSRVLPPQTNLINRQSEFEDDSAQARRKHTYIKIELVTNSQAPPPATGTVLSRIDITPAILNLGITGGPIPVPNPANPLTIPILTGGATPVDPASTYVNAYPLNDGNSINRITDRNLNVDQPENFMPYLADSNTGARIGQDANRFLGAGGWPVKPLVPNSDAAGNPMAQVNTGIAYRYEPNSILRLQRTNIPYSPTNNVDQTTADPPTASDSALIAPNQVLNVLQGRITDANAPAAAGYPAKFKSLIAKPYFRFTDDFDNRTYIKGAYVGGPGNNYFQLSNPYTSLQIGTNNIRRYLLYNNDLVATAATDRRTERFMREVRVRSNTINFANGTVTGQTLDTLIDRNGTNLNIGAAPGFAFDPMRIFDKDANLTPQPIWTNPQSIAPLAYYLRQFVFKPGIPGFFALALPTDTAANAQGRTVVGDGQIDLDVNFANSRGVIGPGTGVAPGTQGVIDLSELTAFGNYTGLGNQTTLQNALFNVLALNSNHFAHLLPDGNNIFSNPPVGVTPAGIPASNAPWTALIGNLRNAEIGASGRSTDPPSAVTPGISGLPEIPKENLTFDWNGDGIIEPPHYPFQNGSTVPEQAYNINSNAAGAGGYSVESNVCSLIPSSLRVLRDAPGANNLNTAQNATTSMPVEIRFVEDNSATTVRVGTIGSDDIWYVPQAAMNSVDPGPGAGFTAANSFRVIVPIGTIPGYRRSTAAANFNIGGQSVETTDYIDTQQAVRVVFQHPLASRIYETAAVAPITAPGTNEMDFTNTTADNLNLETAIGRRLGLTDSHYAFPGHAYMSMTPNAGNPSLPPISNTLLPRLRVEMDRAFPINMYDPREGRHINRAYGFQGVPSQSDYHAGTQGAGTHGITNALWPDFPPEGAGGNQIPDNEFVLRHMSNKLPMPSPVGIERRGLMSVVEIDIGNLKRFFRGDFDQLLTAISGATGCPLTSGQPGSKWGGNGQIDITDNGFIVYVSDRRGDDSRDGIYDFQDVFGNQGTPDVLEDTVNVDPVLSDATRGTVPGDDGFRRDVDVETQVRVGAPAVSITDPVRCGESPHGTMPANDGFEFFSPNINLLTRRSGNPDYQAFNAAVLHTLTATSPTGANQWRMVDSAKTGRVRGFRRAVRIENAMDIPRWFTPEDISPRHFTGMSLASENPVYIHGCLNGIGVSRFNETVENDPISRIPASTVAPTQSKLFLQTGNQVMAGNNPAPGDWGAQALDPYLHGPFAILADAVSIWSRNMTDGRMFLTPNGGGNGDSNVAGNGGYHPQEVLRRIGIDTTVKAAWFTGQPKAGMQNTSQQNINTWSNAYDTSNGPDSPNTQGGLHNFPRFCEYWTRPNPTGPNPTGGGGNNCRFNYNGSFIFDFYSQQGNGPWKIGGPIVSGLSANGYHPGHYSAPVRNWNFDVGFLQGAAGLPPGTPKVVYYKIRGFRQTLLESSGTD